jgi:hypothetical protein
MRVADDPGAAAPENPLLAPPARGAKMAKAEYAPHPRFYDPCSTLIDESTEDYLQDWKLEPPLKNALEWRCLKNSKYEKEKVDYELSDDADWATKTTLVRNAMVERYVQLNFGAPIQYMKDKGEAGREKEIRDAAKYHAELIIPQFSLVGNAGTVSCYAQLALPGGQGKTARVKEKVEACFGLTGVAVPKAVVNYDWRERNPEWETPYERNTLVGAKQRLTECLAGRDLSKLLPEHLMPEAKRRLVASALRRRHPLGVEWTWTYSEKLNCIVLLNDSDAPVRDEGWIAATRQSFGSMRERLIGLYMQAYFPLSAEDGIIENDEESGGMSDAPLTEEFIQYARTQFSNGRKEAERLIPNIHPIFGYIQLEENARSVGPGEESPMDTVAYTLKERWGDDPYLSLEIARKLHSEWKSAAAKNDSPIDVLWTPKENRVVPEGASSEKQRGAPKRTRVEARNPMQTAWTNLHTTDADFKKIAATIRKDARDALDKELAKLAESGPGGAGAVDDAMRAHKEKMKEEPKPKDPRKLWHETLAELAAPGQRPEFESLGKESASESQRKLDANELERRKQFELNLNELMQRTREREKEKESMTADVRAEAEKQDQDFVSSWDLDTQLKYKRRRLLYRIQDIQKDTGQNALTKRDRKLNAMVAHLDQLKDDGLFAQAQEEITRMVAEKEADMQGANRKERDRVKSERGSISDEEIDDEVAVSEAARLENLRMFTLYLNETKEEREQRQGREKKSRKLSPEEKRKKAEEDEEDYQRRSLEEKLEKDSLSRLKYESSANVKLTEKYHEVKGWVLGLEEAARTKEGYELRVSGLYDKVYGVLTSFDSGVDTIRSMEASILSGELQRGSGFEMPQGPQFEAVNIEDVKGVWSRNGFDADAAVKDLKAEKKAYTNVIERAMQRTLHSEWKRYLENKLEMALSPEQRAARELREAQKARSTKYDNKTEKEKDEIVEEEVQKIRSDEEGSAYAKALELYAKYEDDNPGVDWKNLRAKLSGLIGEYMGAVGKKVRRARRYRIVKMELEDGQGGDITEIRTEKFAEVDKWLDDFVYECKKEAFSSEYFGDSQEQRDAALMFLDTSRELTPLRIKLTNLRNQLALEEDGIGELPDKLRDAIRKQEDLIAQKERVQTFSTNVRVTLDSVVRQTYRLSTLMNTLGNLFKLVTPENPSYRKELHEQLQRAAAAGKQYVTVPPDELFTSSILNSKSSSFESLEELLLSGPLLQKYSEIAKATEKREIAARKKREDALSAREKVRQQERKEAQTYALAQEMAEQSGLFSLNQNAKVLRPLKPGAGQDVDDILQDLYDAAQGDDEAEEELSNNEELCKGLLENIARQEIDANDESMETWFHRTAAQFADYTDNRLDWTFEALLGFVQLNPARRPRDEAGNVVQSVGVDREPVPGLRKDYKGLKYMESEVLVRDAEGAPLFFGGDDYVGSSEGGSGKSYRYTPAMPVDKAVLAFDLVPTPCAEVRDWQAALQGGQRRGQWELVPPRELQYGEHKEESYKKREVRFKELYRYCFIQRTPMRYSMFQRLEFVKFAQEAAAPPRVLKVEHSDQRPGPLFPSKKWHPTDHVRLMELPVWGGDSEAYAKMIKVVNFIFVSVLGKKDDAAALRRQAQAILGTTSAPAASIEEEQVADEEEMELETAAAGGGSRPSRGGDVFGFSDDEGDDEEMGAADDSDAGSDSAAEDSEGESDDSSDGRPGKKKQKVKAKAGSRTMSDRLRMLVLE